MNQHAATSLQISDLQRGDVLLSLGHGWLSDLIVFLDGGRYSHAGFFDGEKVIEASRAGIARRDVTEDLKEQQYIHVYRYKGDHGEHLGGDGFPVEPLIQVADKYLKSGAAFAYQQLLLLALLATTRRGPLPLFLKKLLRTALDDAVSVLNDILQDGKQPVICSELVYRIFYEAPPDNRYGLTIRGVIDVDEFNSLATAKSPSPSKTAGDDDDIAQFERLRHEFAAKYLQAKAGLIKGPNPLVKADFVTPSDLETSPNFEEIGELTRPAALMASVPLIASGV